MAIWFWKFLIYSFAGFLLERGYAWATHAQQQARKGFLLLPLCPVYGLGVTAVLALPPTLRTGPGLLLFGAVVTTAVEYAVHWVYDALLHVRFWDYTGVWGNLRGRVCLPFSLAWGGLIAIAVWVVDPPVQALAGLIPLPVTFGAVLLVTADTVCSIQVLRHTHDTQRLQWGALHQT